MQATNLREPGSGTAANQAATDKGTLFREQVVRESHRRVHPCFMTGKACVYADVIERGLSVRKESNSCAGFMLMPSRQNFEVFFENCLVPFVEANYGGDRGQTGDKVRRPGVVICEGICKRIQESNFVVADISVPSPLASHSRVKSVQNPSVSSKTGGFIQGAC